MSAPDPVELTAELIRHASVTPHSAGALDVLQAHLEAAGFTCTRLPFSEPGTPDVDNLFARLGTRPPHFCFAGHVDVVPPGDESRWAHPPFAAQIADGYVHGRGAVDMKGAVAGFVSAAIDYAGTHKGDIPGSISLLITGDEEGPSINGTRKMLKWLEAEGQIPDHCLVGEPSNPAALGEAIKIGRRGSLSSRLTVIGMQGHAAYPHLADNPVHKIVRMLDEIASKPLDEGTEFFEPSSLQVTGIETGNPATNVIPERITAQFNIRFNETHSAESLKAWLHERFGAVIAEMGGRYELEHEPSSDCFRTEPGPLIDVVRAAVAARTNREPALTTNGGTSDARFIKDYCPVIEFGLTGQTMHKTDECVAVEDLTRLTDIYRDVLDGYFARFAG
ncbi:MAG: succinyl-diaminopimelate desuccinylase [Hyphomicrobiales bacterium]|nr:MAG: succinyl-diaminopimelate desuccinylase [Hyphomicrobiales bacterium]